jgi:hypothetical protein
MTNQTLPIADARPLPTPRAGARNVPLGGLRFDWTMVLLSAWFLGGLFLDGWAHTHGKVDQSFFTPWHAVLYSGQLVVMLFLGAQWLNSYSRGYSWREALPAGYGWSLLGVLLWIPGGVGDLIWHTLFGIEKDVAALYSPTHLILALGLALAVSGPWRAAWGRPDSHETRGWRGLGPMVVSVAYTLSLLTFFIQIAHPLANLWGTAVTGPATEEQGVISILLDSALLMGTLLLVLRRWALPRGALTLIVALNAILMGVLFDQGAYPLVLVVARIAAGAVADGLFQVIRPSAARPAAWRLFAFSVPVVVYAFYFGAAQLTGGITWIVHLWVGSIVLAGVVGLLVSYLILPPAVPEAAA